MRLDEGKGRVRTLELGATEFPVVFQIGNACRLLTFVLRRGHPNPQDGHVQ